MTESDQLPEPSLSTNPLLRLLAINAGIGAGIALLLTVGMILSNAANLGTLIANSDSPVVPVALLFGGFLVTMTSVAMGTAVMLLPYADDDRTGGGGGRRGRVEALAAWLWARPSLAAVPVRARRR